MIFCFSPYRYTDNLVINFVDRIRESVVKKNKSFNVMLLTFVKNTLWIKYINKTPRFTAASGCFVFTFRHRTELLFLEK